MRLPFLLVDAFTDRVFGGTPHAVILDADDLSEATMQAIAREMNHSETAFVQRSNRANFRVRYFGPNQEILMAGSPTIATVHALAETGRLALNGALTPVALELRNQILKVEVLATNGGGRHIFLELPKPVFQRIYSPTDAAAFSIEVNEILPGLPIQTVSAGIPQLMVPLRNHDALRRAQPNWLVYDQLRKSGDFSSAFLFCLGGATPDGQTFARHFWEPPNVEDAATGSATGAMAAYLWHYRLLGRPTFAAEQGHWLERPSTIHAKIVGPPEEIESVRIGGQAMVVMMGELSI